MHQKGEICTHTRGLPCHIYSRLVFPLGYSSEWHCGAVCAAEEVFLQGEKVSVCWRFWFREWIWRQSGNLKSSFNSSWSMIDNLVQ